MGGLLRGLHLLLLAAWFGGAVMLLAAVAPGAFDVLPTRESAGRMVGVVLERLDLFALFAAPVLFATAVHDESTRGTPTARWVRVSILVALATEAAISRFIITPRMSEIRASAAPAAGPGSAPALGPEFEALHGISMVLLIFGIACVVAALFFAARRRPMADLLQAGET
jgi:hypothetical protein